MTIVKNIAALVGMGLLAGLGSLVALIAALVVASHMVGPLPVDPDTAPELRVQKQSILIDICREVESGALDARTENNCNKGDQL